MGRRTIVLVVAIVLAVVSGFAVYQFLSNVEDDARADITEVKVFRATEVIVVSEPGDPDARQKIEESTALREHVVFEGSTILCEGPTDPDVPLEEGCPENPKDLNTLLQETFAAGPISAGQLITTEMFVSAADLNDVTLSESIPEGKVAISIQPEAVAAVGGFVRPGDRVNLIASAEVEITSFVAILQDPVLRALIFGDEFGVETTTTTTLAPGEIPDEGATDAVSAFAETIPTSFSFTQTVLQDVEVLAIGVDTRPAPIGNGLEPQGTQIVVLEVTPQDAEKIEFARQYTTIALMLLPADHIYQRFDSQGVVVDDLFDLLDRILEEVEEATGGAGS